MKGTRAKALLLLALAAASACRGPRADRTVLSVYAASSLTEAFGELEHVFEAAHPEIDVALTLAGSQVLRLQIEQGARADVFASANAEHMRALVGQGLIREPSVFAHNQLVVIVPLDNPSEIESFEDLRRAERLVLGTVNVPVGRYARDAIARASERYGADFEADVLDGLVSEESNVRLARSKVELNEADAAIVYRTDAASSSEQVRVLPIPDELNPRAEYPIGLVEGGPAPEWGRRWIDLVMSAEGREVLGRYGFVVD